MREGSPYFAAYPEVRDREAHDPLTPSQLRVEDNRFVSVPLPYDLRLLGGQNIFSGNHFVSLAPAVQAVLQVDQTRKPLTSWPAWQAAGFDADAVLEPKLGREDRRKLNAIIRAAGPRDAPERIAQTPGVKRLAE